MFVFVFVLWHSIIFPDCQKYLNFVQNDGFIQSSFAMQSYGKQARKPRSYASSKLRLTDLPTGVKCRATSVAKKNTYKKEKGRGVLITGRYLEIVSHQFSTRQTTQCQGLKTHIFVNLTFFKGPNHLFYLFSQHIICPMEQ